MVVECSVDPSVFQQVAKSSALHSAELSWNRLLCRKSLRGLVSSQTRYVLLNTTLLKIIGHDHPCAIFLPAILPKCIAFVAMMFFLTNKNAKYKILIFPQLETNKICSFIANLKMSCFVLIYWNLKSLLYHFIRLFHARF